MVNIGKTTSTYSEYTGTVPFTFRSDGSNLDDWEITGNTGGVGDKTSNLFSCDMEQGGLSSSTGGTTVNDTRIRTDDYISVTQGIYTLSIKESNKKVVVYVYDSEKNYVRESSITSWQNLPIQIEVAEDCYLKFAFAKDDNSAILPTAITEIMLNSGTKALSFEPYGYVITVNCGNETKNIYLDAALDASDSISMTDTGISISTVDGSNTLSVGTAVQPSSVYIKYKRGGDEMVTLVKIGNRYNTPILEIRGLSTDAKPTTKIEGMSISNGSTYIEIDTGDTYMFDAENGVWYNVTV